MANIDKLENCIDKYFHNDPQIETYINKIEEIGKVVRNAIGCFQESGVEAFEIHLAREYKYTLKKDKLWWFRVFRDFNPKYYGKRFRPLKISPDAIAERIFWAFCDEFEYCKRNGGNAIWFEYDYYSPSDFNKKFKEYFEPFLYTSENVSGDKNFRILVVRFISTYDKIGRKTPIC